MLILILGSLHLLLHLHLLLLLLLHCVEIQLRIHHNHHIHRSSVLRLILSESKVKLLKVLHHSLIILTCHLKGLIVGLLWLSLSLLHLMCFVHVTYRWSFGLSTSHKLVD